MAKLQTNPTPLNFAEMVGDVAIDTPAGFQEQRVWQLLALLFDNPDVIPEGVDAEHMDLFRKEQLSDFWRAIVWDDAQKHAQKASSVEEKAIAHLTCNNVAEACHCLLSGFDLRLATMVAQIGGDMSMRESLITQIEQWRRLDVLAEMEDSTRALYELLSGNCAKSEGKQDFSREIKASTFGISKRFKLDWRRAFGLRLWYGTTPTESIDMAVAQLATALKDGAEDVKPVPWFVETRTDMGWTDPHADDREDLLWGVLKLYASTKLELDANIEDVLAPENISGNPLNARLAFQLFQLFKSRQQDATESDLRKVAMPTVRSQSEDLHRRSLQSSVSSHYAKDEQAENPLVELGDKITLTYAASLHTPEHWTTGIWVYAHLSSPTMREHYIQLLLNQFCNTYALEEADPTYVYLTNDLKIPTTWLHAAAALYAKTQGDALQQASHLIKAKELDEAHEVLCRKVGPEAIISRDYDALRELIGGFLPESQNSTTLSVASRVEKSVPGWRQGGQIYFDYIELLDLTSQRATYRVDEDLNERIQELLVKLQRALEITARERLELCGLEERVALMEIAGTVAAQIAKSSVSP
jgi:nuclear pore complex protein Nup98-Nup96